MTKRIKRHPYDPLVDRIFSGKNKLSLSDIAALLASDEKLGEMASRVPISLADPVTELRHVLEPRYRAAAEKEAVRQALLERRRQERADKLMSERRAIEWVVRGYRLAKDRFPLVDSVVLAKTRQEAISLAAGLPGMNGLIIRVRKASSSPGRSARVVASKATSESELWNYQSYNSWREWIVDVMNFRGLTRPELGRRYGGSYAISGYNTSFLLELYKRSTIDYIHKIGDVLNIPDSVIMSASRYFLK